MSRLVSFALLASVLSFTGACSKAESRGTDVAGATPQSAPPSAAAPEVVAVPGAPAPGGAAAPAPGQTGLAGQAAGAPAGAPDTSFKLDVVAPGPGAAGAEAVARVTVTPGPGWKMNEEYPTKLTVQAPEGVTVAKAEQVLSDAAKFDPQTLAFDVKVTAAKPGTYPVSGTLKFAVCTDATCDPKKQTIAFDVVAK